MTPFTPTLSLVTATYQRPKTFQDQALPSVLAQQAQAQDWEWIVINDGEDPTIAHSLETLQSDILLRHLPLQHPTDGFGLCHARNLGLAVARGEWVAYLDDDNQLAPNYICQILNFLRHHPQLHCAMVQQQRRRDRAGQPGPWFISPSADCTTDALISQKELFDSNGFIHRRLGAPAWNPDYRIFCDYDYLLSCLLEWGEASFGICPQMLLEYVQSSTGEIGRSRYRDWATELQQILQLRGQHPLIAPYRDTLEQQVHRWQRKGDQPIPAFS